MVILKLSFLEEFYLQEIVMLCDISCKTWTEATLNDCETFYDGYYLDDILNTCEFCDNSCKTCTGATLNDCETCYDGYYLDNDLNTCEFCDISCKTCTGATGNEF